MSRGLSLLEVLVATALIAILAGFATLNHQAMRPRLDLRMAARQVVLDLRLARLRAIAENVNHRVIFLAGAANYQPQRKSGGAYADDGIPVSLPLGVLISGCTAPDNGISFKPRGNAASFGTVTLRNRDGDEQRVVVDIAGQVRVQG